MLGNAGGKIGMANKPQPFLRYPMVYRKSIPSSERDKNSSNCPLNEPQNCISRFHGIATVPLHTL